MKRKSSKPPKQSTEPKDVSDKEITIAADSPMPATLALNNKGRALVIAMLFGRDNEAGIPEVRPFATIPVNSGDRLEYSAPKVVKISLFCPAKKGTPLYSYKVTFKRPAAVAAATFRVVTSRASVLQVSANNMYSTTDDLKVTVSTVDGSGKRFSTVVDSGVSSTINKRGVEASLVIKGSGITDLYPSCSIEVAN